MTPDPADDYVFGTHDDEIARLGVQHRAWRPIVLDCWKRAGIGPGSRVLDVGAGPGFTTIDMADVVGPTGEVVAVERSSRFVRALVEECGRRSLHHVQVREADLMNDPVPARGLDAAWCRWVACFVPSPRTLVDRIAAALKPGGVAVFHEYADYGSWRFLPPRPRHAEFVCEVMANWRASGGEPDVAPALVGHLRDAGFVIRAALPRVYCIGPADPMWPWVASFTEVHPDRLVKLGRVGATWADAVRDEFRTAQADPGTRMITPMVLEVAGELGTK